MDVVEALNPGASAFPAACCGVSERLEYNITLRIEDSLSRQSGTAGNFNTRFTTRAFKSDPIDRKTLEKVLEAALRAPSWANTQPWSIFDLGLFSQSLMLAGRHFGLDSVPAVTLAAHPDLIRKELKIPDGLSIIIGIALGYADAEHPQNKFRSPRRVVKEAVVFKGI